MRLLVYNVGTLGDILPLVTLCRRLVQRGHEVRLHTHKHYGALVRNAGLDFVGIDESTDPKAQMQALAVQRTSQGVFGRWKSRFAVSESPPRPALEQLESLIRESDAFLTGYTCVYHAAVGAGKPFGLLGLSPRHPTRHFPNPLTRSQRSLGPCLNWFSHRLVDRSPHQLMEILRLIADRLGRRILLLSGWLPDLHFESHPNICRADFVPLRWMLPRVAAYVHHAGAGTMAEVLRAGTPSVAVPSSGEQHFWAFRMHQMGVIPDPISRKHLTGSALSGSIAETLDHPKMNARRASVSEALKKEDGDNRAADLIEEWLAECCSNNSLRHGR